MRFCGFGGVERGSRDKREREREGWLTERLNTATQWWSRLSYPPPPVPTSSHVVVHPSKAGTCGGQWRGG